MTGLLTQLPLVAAGIAFTLALGELFVAQRNAKTWLYTLLQFCLGAMLLHAHWLFHGGIEEHLWFFRLQTIPSYVIGPLLLIYFRMVLSERSNPPRRDLLHFVPALLVALALVPLLFQSPAEKLEAIAAVRARSRDNLDYGVLLFLLGVAHCAGYLAVALGMVLWQTPRRRWFSDHAVRLVLLLGVLGFALAVLTVTSVFGGFFWMTEVVLVLLSGIIVLVHVLGRRYPHFFFDLVFAVHAEKYRTSLLKNVDLDAIEQRLSECMEREQLYRDDGLTLAQLSEQVGLSAHQLSEYFNNRLGVNFNTFVNDYRVDEAARLLVDQPERTVLSIAFAVGFNSKSSFNTAFARVAGTTPTAYRANRLSPRSKS